MDKKESQKLESLKCFSCDILQDRIKELEEENKDRKKAMELPAPVGEVWMQRGEIAGLKAQVSTHRTALEEIIDVVGGCQSNCSVDVCEIAYKALEGWE